MRNRGAALRLLAGIALLVVIGLRIDWGQVGEVFKGVRVTWLLPVFLLYTADRLFMAGKWRYLLRALGVTVSFTEATAHYYMGGAVGLAVQWQSGGDLARIADVGHRTRKYGAVSTSVVLEKIAGLNALTLVAVGSCLLLNHEFGFIPQDVVIGAAVPVIVVLCILPFLTVPYFPARRIGRLLERIPIDRLDSLGQEVADFDRSAELAAVYPKFFVLTLAEQLMPILGLALFAYALRIPITLVQVASFLPISMFAGRIPISVEAIGVREGLYVFFLSLYGVAGGTAFALAIATRVMDVSVVGSGSLVSSAFLRDSRSAPESGYRST